MGEKQRICEVCRGEGQFGGFGAPPEECTHCRGAGFFWESEEEEEKRMGTWTIKLKLSDGVKAVITFEAPAQAESKALDQAADRFAMAAAGVFIERAQGTLSNVVEAISYTDEIEVTTDFDPKDVSNTVPLPPSSMYVCKKCGEHTPRKGDKKICQSCTYDESTGCPDCGGEMNIAAGICEGCGRTL